MKSYHLYKLKHNRRKFVATIEAEDEKTLRKLIKRAHPELEGWDALRTKYVIDKATGAMKGPPYPVDTTLKDWENRVKAYYKKKAKKKAKKTKEAA